MKYQFTIRTTSTSLLASTPLTSTYKTNTSNTSTIAGSVVPVLVVILLVVLAVLFWKKKKEFGMTFSIVLISNEFSLYNLLKTNSQKLKCSLSGKILTIYM